MTETPSHRNFASSQLTFTGRLSAMKETFKSIIYITRRFKLPSTLNILGLILAFATFYLLMTQIRYQASYNHGVNDYERLYRLECDYTYPEWGFSDNICRPFAEALERVPQVESYSLVNSDIALFTFVKDDKEMVFTATNGNNTVISALAGKPLDGSIEWNDKDQGGLIIPASIALSYFGTTQVAGDSMIMNYDGETFGMKIKGVYEDFPENSELRNCIYMNLWDSEKGSLNFSQKCYVKLKEPLQNLDAVNQDIKKAIIDEISDSLLLVNNNPQDVPLIKETIQKTDVRLIPLKNSYFESSTYTEGDKGYRGMFVFLILGSIIVVVIGTINFLNCTLVESPMRIKSINTRLVLGAARSKMRQRLITESVIISVTSCLVALAVCSLLSLMPPEKLLMTGSIALKDHWSLALVIFAMSFVLGIIAGWYPAKFATSFQPAIALKASFGLTPQGIRLRNLLVFFQLLVSIMMVTYIGVLYMQSRHIFNSDYGFDKDQILMTEIPLQLSEDSVSRLCQELTTLPGIAGISRSSNQLASTDGQYMIRADIDGEPFMYRMIMGDPDYMRVMGIKITRGRDFLPNDTAAIIVNEIACDSIEKLQLGRKVSIGFGGNSQDSATVVGVCRNIRYGTMRMTQNQPFFFIVDKKTSLDNLNIRIADNADRDQVFQQATDLIKKYSSSDASQLVTFNNQLYETYHYELLYFRQTYTISLICIILTLVGLFCLTMFETEYRRKEIGIRKVAGATTSEIVRMLSKHYVTLIIISFVIAAPIAYLLGKLTLNYFADSTPIHWWIFPLALLLGGSITLGTVILQSWRTARENPVNSIKTE